MYLHIRTSLAFLVFLLTVVIVTVMSVPVVPIFAQEEGPGPAESPGPGPMPGPTPGPGPGPNPGPMPGPGPGPMPGPPAFENDCSNSIDDDEDGDIDCDDSDCAADPICPQPENCTDLIDNDQDGYIDCDDDDCSTDPACAVPEVGNCDDGEDNDLDGDIDCDDEDCSDDDDCSEEEEEEEEEEESEEACSDMEDNDGDGDIDCDDSECNDFNVCACGDGECSISDSESCSTCALDCGSCPPKCGDGACQVSLEDCNTCEQDCGACPRRYRRRRRIIGEPKEPEIEVIEEPAFSGCGNDVCEEGEQYADCPSDCDKPAEICGNGRCIASENYSNCPDDCHLPRRLAKRLRGQEIVMPTSIESAFDLLEDAITEDEQLLSLIPESDVQLIFEIVESQDFGSIGKRKLGQLIYSITKASKEAGDALRQAIAFDFIGNPEVLDDLYTLPRRDILIEAARHGDLVTVQKLLPESERGLGEVIAELDDVKADVVSLMDMDEEVSDAVSFLGTAFAQEELGEMTAKERFIESIDLLKRMRAQAQDPNAALPSLEERLEYLQNRRYTMAGIITIDPEKLEDDLNEVQGQAQTSSLKKLIKLAGIMQFIRSTANFEKIESSFVNAVQSMRTGFGRVRALIARGVTISPRAEAASLLGDDGFAHVAERLQGDDLDAQKQAISDLFATLPLLDDLDMKERQSVEKRAQELRNAIQRAESSRDLHDVIAEWDALLQNIQTAAREKRNFLLRFGYRIQDFFGSHS